MSTIMVWTYKFEINYINIFLYVLKSMNMGSYMQMNQQYIHLHGIDLRDV